MPPPPILIAKAFSGAGLSQVHELVNGTAPTQIGVDVPATIDRSLTVDNKTPMSGYTKTFKGQRYFLGIGTGAGFPASINRENEGGAGTWGQVLTTVPTVNESSLSTTGLHIIKDGADIALCFALGSGANIVVYKSNTGDSGDWTSTVLPSGVGSPVFRSPSVTFNNRIYVHDFNNSRVWEIDPSGATLTGYILAGLFAASLAVVGDRLLMLSDSDVGGGELGHNLYELSGGGLSLNSVLEGGIPGRAVTGLDQGQPLLFEDPLDPGKLIAIVNGRRSTAAGSQGSRVFQGTPSGSIYTWVEDAADLTMLAGLIPGARGSIVDAMEDRFAVWIDNDTDPANPVAYVIATGGPAPGTVYELARWEGWLQRMGSGAVSGDAGPGVSVSTDFSIGHSPLGGGEDISQGSASYGEIEGELAAPGAYRLSFRVPGLVGPLTGRVYYSAGQGYPRTLATLLGGLTTFGPITGDDRATLFTVDVDLALSGITAPDASSWMIDLR